MNFYVIAEGELGIKKLYQKWIPLINNRLKNIDYVNEFNHNNFYILYGYGQPRFWERVSTAIQDVNSNDKVNRLVIAFDSEEQDHQTKLSEATNYVNSLSCNVEVKFIVQHFCVETWLLANINIFRKRPHTPLLREFYTRFDIRNLDPELLPNYQQKGMNTRAQFAYEYLRQGIYDMHGAQKYYNKRNPGIALEDKFFIEIKKRHEKIHHIPSFKGLLDAFI